MTKVNKAAIGDFGVLYPPQGSQPNVGEGGMNNSDCRSKMAEEHPC